RLGRPVPRPPRPQRPHRRGRPPGPVPLRPRLLRPRLPPGPGRRRGGPGPVPRPPAPGGRDPPGRRPLPPGKGPPRAQHRVATAQPGGRPVPRRPPGVPCGQPEAPFPGRATLPHRGTRRRTGRVLHASGSGGASAVRLSDEDQPLLGGAEGPPGQLAMRIVVEMGRVAGAAGLIDVSSAHIDGCLYHGRAGVDFAERLRRGRAERVLRAGAAVRVPTTLNVASLDLLHPDRFRGDPETAAAARRLMDAYVAMGCRQTWTCAPYQLPERPGFGEHVAWAESNAIVFANSVLGARTARYGDFIDICAAITGRVPNAGLHLTGRRRGQLVFDVRALPDGLLHQDALYPLVGHLVGARSGRLVPVVDGLPAGVDEDRLKALGAAAASSGEVGLVHVGVCAP